jgi:hypothetical protein
MAEAASYVVTRAAGSILVTVPNGSAYYWWYLDGLYWGRTETPQLRLWLPEGDEAVVYCEANDDADWDWIANAPDGWPARRTVWFVRSVDDDVAEYVCQYATGESEPAEEDWTTFARVPQRDWTHRVATDRLADLTWHWLRVVPYDRAGNAGTARRTHRKEYIVRTPDMPDVTVAFDDGTQRITVDAA